MADDVGNKSKAATTGEQASQMLGCGCLVLFVSFAGPIITNWLGLSPWPIAIAFALALAVAWFSSANPFPFPRAFLVSILAIGAIGGYAFGGKVEEDNAKVAAAPTTAPASSPAPTPTIGGQDIERAQIYALMTAIRDAGRVYLVAGRKTSVRIDLGGCAADA